ncbi:MAG: beta-N-acetylglucosaminidase domain-containing protein [Crocinitomicaceae bacterium]|nr:beta-N-acetylglucosaminidase domain-containing protein [Crocinitomicaceae bacterium]
MAKTTTSCGIIMGYYGKIWSKEELIDYATFCKSNGYSYFIYGPKMDNYLRSNWRTPWPEDKFQDLKEVRKAFKSAGVAFGVAFSPFDIHDFTSEVKSDLKTRLEGQIAALDLDILSIGFDDYDPNKFKPYKDTIAQTQVDIANYIKEKIVLDTYYVVPTYYSKDPLTVMADGPVPLDYWTTFGTLDSSFNIFWCGSAIIPNGFSVNEINEMNSIFKRNVTIWDNYPCNDPNWMTRSAANTYPFTGRPANLSSVIEGHFANPMIQPNLSKIPLMTLPKVYSEGSSYSAQDQFEKSTLAICEHSELAKFIIHNIMSFREISYRPDYGICTQYMQKTIQTLKGSEAIKKELEEWFEFVQIKGLPNLTLPADQYLSQGSYLKTSTDITIEISANCEMPDGTWKKSTLKYTADQTGNLTDIANTNGQLTLESSGPLVKNTHINYGKFVPAGSYQITSNDIQITIFAECLNDKQIASKSSLSFAASENSTIEDIKNINGVLTLIQ